MLKSATAFVLAPLFYNENSRNKPEIKAIAFDAFALFDTAPLTKTAEELFPGKGKELMTAWRTKQFEYTWLRGLSKQYKDFTIVTINALNYATDFLKLDLTDEKKKRLMRAFQQLRFTPDTRAVLAELKNMSLKLSILSNAAPAMLDAAVSSSGVRDLFDFIISTDSIKSYKPDPAAYQLAIDAFKMKRNEILFVAFGGWDAAGAKSFGFSTAWINKLKVPTEQLDANPDVICENLNELLSYVKTIAG